MQDEDYDEECLEHWEQSEWDEWREADNRERARDMNAVKGCDYGY